MRIKIFSIFILILLIPVSVLAQVSVRATLDPPSGTMEDEFNLTVSVSGATESGTPVLPVISAFKIVSSGTSTSIQIINGTVSSSKKYSFVLIPQAEGNFTIEPIAVTVDGKQYQSQPLQVSVGKSAYANSPPVNGVGGPQIPQGYGASPSSPMPALPTQKESRDFWVEALASKKDPYENEQLLYTFRFYTRVRLGDLNWTPPDFTGFWAEEVVPEKKYYQEIGGDRFIVSEKVLALFPSKSGKLTIPPSELKVAVPESVGNPFFDDPFFGAMTVRTRTKIIKSSPIELNVKPLPDSPKDFTGLVGHFHLDVTLDPQNLKVGDTATLTYKITGDGNIKDASLPWQKDVSGFKIYEDKPTQDLIRTEKGVQGSKVFKRALVPLASGSIDIPEENFSYFNPDTAQYENLKSPAFQVAVTPSETEEPLQATQIQGNQKNQLHRPEDIATIHTDLAMLTDRTQSSGFSLFFMMFSLCAPPLMYCLLLVLKRVKMDRQKNVAFYRQRRAYKNFRKKMDALYSKKDAADILECLMNAVRDYFGDHWSVFGNGLTVEDILPRLEATGVDRQKMEELRQFFSLYETWRYGHQLPQEDSYSLVARIIEMIKVIDRRM